ncbi:hypothetical protein HK413_02360 [Mucilaginibacter sp. S1162]|uniref:DUF4919 domain-containing protein n=1 Tax=Mucilaginibacter humi TaxID=2732510 RepID=A0ABX1W3Z8_9SPHI|nr:hypothetical protein [Mucilaginibacter humi]NNU33301.1 hypothetical protein [Mucilaginibacter humi]
MKKVSLLLLTIFIVSSANAQSAADSTLQKFSALLDETGMVFKKPEGTIQIPIVKNMQMHYEYAVKYADKPLEIRYAIASLKDRVDEYNEWKKNPKPGEIRTDPNTLAKSMAYVVALNVGGGAMDKSIGFNAFPPQDVKAEFGADWGGTSIIPVKNTSFGTDYKWCLMLVLHKNSVADSYVFYLTDTREHLNGLLKDDAAMVAFYALKFKQ